MKIVVNIIASILIFFGVLFIWGAFSPNGSTGWIPVGLISVAIGLALIFFINRKKSAPGDQNVVVKIDLPGNMTMESMKCRSCGGVLSAENITLSNGAPIVTCPYCKTTYQITEEPKW